MESEISIVGMQILLIETARRRLALVITMHLLTSSRILPDIFDLLLDS